MPDSKLSASEQAQLLDDLFEASNDVLDYNRKLIMYSFDEKCSSQKEYIFSNLESEGASKFCSRVNSERLWAVAFVNGEISLERSYIAACKMTGAIPDEFDKVAIIPSGSYVYPAKGEEDLHTWLARNGFFIVYYYDYNEDECQTDVLADIGSYSIYDNLGPYSNVVYMDSINKEKADIAKLNRFWNMIPEECKLKLYQHVAFLVMHETIAFWGFILPGLHYGEIMNILSFGKCTDEIEQLDGIDIGDDEVVLVLPPETGSTEEQMVLQARQSKIWQYAWRKTFLENGVRMTLKRPVRNIELFKQLGRFLEIDRRAEDILSSEPTSLSDLNVSSGFSTFLPHFAALHEAVEEYMVERPGRTSLAHIKSEVEKCGFKVEDTKLYALFEEGFAFEAADDHAMLDEYDETMYFYYDEIRGFDDVYLSEEPVCFALMDANVAWCGLGTRAYQYATALSVLDSSLDKETGWMVAFSISGDGDRVRLAELLDQFGPVAYDETNNMVADVIAGQYSLGPKGPSISKDAVMRKERALKDRKCGKTIVSYMKECSKTSKRFSSEDAAYALSVFAIMADAFTFSDELGDLLRSQTLLSIPNQDINIMLDTMLECVDVDEPAWVENVKYLSDITQIWSERLGQLSLKVAFDTCPEEMEEGKAGLRKLGEFLGIDDDLETFKHGVPCEDIIA